MSQIAVQALQGLIDRRSLERPQMVALMREMMRGELAPALVGALLAALRCKGETVTEIAAAAEVMREFAVKVEVADPSHFVDIVGTGGDGAHTFNISTASMFVASAAGARVAKHGNRSVSSRSGSADVLEALGADIQLGPAEVAACLQQCGAGFMFAPLHHPAMKAVIGVRRELGVRTVFNILGPLTNPASAPNIVLGVFSESLVPVMLEVLQRLGAQRALVVWGRDGMDEITMGAATCIGELGNGSTRIYDIHPRDFGLELAASHQLRVADAEESKQMLLQALSGASGAARDVVSLNAGAALYAAGVVNSIADGRLRALAAIDSGAARQQVDRFVALSQALGAKA